MKQLKLNVEDNIPCRREVCGGWVYYTGTCYMGVKGSTLIRFALAGCEGGNIASATPASFLKSASVDKAISSEEYCL